LIQGFRYYTVPNKIDKPELKKIHSMDRFRNILLVFTPPNQGVIQNAIALAERNQARLKIVDVIENTDVYQGLVAIKSAEELQEVIAEVRRKEIEAALRDFHVPLSKVAIKILFGSPAEEIIREVIRGDHDLVVKTASQTYGIRAKLFGATGLQLLRKCPRPVWIIKPDSIANLNRVLAAVDVSGEKERNQELNRLIIDLAYSLSKTPGGHLDVIYCWQLPGESILSSGRTQISEKELGKDLKIAERFHRKKLEEFLRDVDFSKVSHEVHLVKDDPAHAIPQFAKDLHADTLIMGTVGRTGLDGWITGNTAEKVLNQIDCSVFAMKPLGFISPVSTLF
jgi:nucleotide-binding universal stress UspA family protein